MKFLIRLIRKEVSFLFDTDYNRAFLELKKRLVSILILIHYYPDRKIKIETDALDGIIAGAIL